VAPAPSDDGRDEAVVDGVRDRHVAVRTAAYHGTVLPRRPDVPTSRRGCVRRRTPPGNATAVRSATYR